MLVFTVMSPDHKETDVDLFVEDTFDFENVYARAWREEIAPGIVITVVPRTELIEMKRRAGRAIDRADLEALEMIEEAGDNPDV